MHIGLVTAAYLPVVNGVTRMVALYKEYLEAAGHQVTIFTFGESAEKNDAESIVRSRGIRLSDSGYFFALRYSQEARQSLSNVDIIHCHHLVMGLEYAHRYGQSPIVFTNHTRHDLYAQYYLRLPKQVAKKVLRFSWPRLMAYSDAVIVPSESVKRLLRLYGSKQRIEIIPNGIKLERFGQSYAPLTRRKLGIPKSSTLIIFVGRLAQEKNLEKLLLEFSLSAQNDPSLVLMLVGDGPSREKLRRLADNLGLGKRVMLTDKIDPDKVPHYLSAADIFATASQSEVAPLTIIEAMASGLPTVAIDSPGIIDLIQHEKTGLLSSSERGALSRNINSMANNPARRLQLGKNARVASQRYNIRHTVRETLDLYRSLLSERASSTKLVNKLDYRYQISPRYPYKSKKSNK